MIEKIMAMFGYVKASSIKKEIVEEPKVLTMKHRHELIGRTCARCGKVHDSKSKLVGAGPNKYCNGCHDKIAGLW